MGRSFVGKKPELHLAGHGDVLLELALLSADSLIQPGILNGNGDLRGQRGEHAFVFFIEEGGARVFQIEHADDAAFIEKRHDQLRLRLGVHGQVARILADVGNIDGTPLAYRGAYEAGACGNAAHGRMRIAKTPGVACDERLAFLVEQHDREHLVVDEAAQELADALEQRIEIENRCQLDGNFIEHFQGLRLA